MFEKSTLWFYKNLKTILLFTTAFFLIGTIYLASKWKCQANSFGDNILIEFFIGGLFLFVPILLGIYIGRKAKEIQFYDKIKNLLYTIKSHREKGDITSVATREIIVEFSNAIGDEILEEDWLKKLTKKEKISGIANCGICGLTAETAKENEGSEKEKCKYCKLDCFSWK